MTPTDSQWHSDIEPARQVKDASAVDWTETADVIVVGLGGAGAACALQSLEHGLSVIALDRFESGGATKMSGGVIYAGGGTQIQKAAGVEDTPKNMFNYLKLEVGDIVSDDCLRDFCEQSVPTIDWMRGHGVDMRPTLYAKKTSYPGPEYFLYHSDNSLVPSYAKHATPAARGHRGYAPVEQSRKATNLGGAFFDPMKAAATDKGMALRTYTEVRQLVTDTSGRVIGVKALTYADPATLEKFKTLRAKANKMMALVLPIIPGSKILLRKALKKLEEAKTLESQREEIFIRANKGVLLSAGGFVFNSKMVDHYAPKYSRGYPLGTEGDNGAGIRLGQTAGGIADNMDRITAWRFINPPLSFARGFIVNMDGKRFTNEMVYGATLGVEMTEHHGGDAWMILDKALVRQALADVSGRKALNFQKALAQLNVRFGAKKGKTIAELAQKIGVNAGALEKQLDEYNQYARGEAQDPLSKTQEDCAEIKGGPYIGINIGLGASLFPCPTLTLGGLKVDDKTGQVLSGKSKPIPGLYAAGRNAIGIASWNYVSGLSIADGVYSGRRAARAMAE